MALVDFVSSEGRYAMLQRSDPDRAAQLMELAQADVDETVALLPAARRCGRRSVPHLAEHLADDAVEARTSTEEGEA